MTVSCVQFTCDRVGTKTAVVNGPVPIYKLGYFWWDLDGYHHDLQYIRFQKQLFIPPNLKVTSWGFTLFPGVTGNFRTVYTKLADDPLSVLGNVLSAYQGKIPGLAQTLLGGTQGTAPTVTKLGTNQRLKSGGFN